jgi:signal transduction histidine kinase
VTLSFASAEGVLLAPLAQHGAPAVSTADAPPVIGGEHSASGDLPAPQAQPAVAPLNASITAHVAHDMRGPLQAITISAELLHEDLDALDAEHARALSRTIYRSAIWLQGLVENLLCIESVRTGRFEITPRDLDLHEIIEQCAAVVEPVLGQKQQRLKLHLPQTTLPPLWADGRRLGQVLMNLILNASKYSPANTVIEVCACAEDNAVRVSVEDEGPGIPAHAAERLFAPFERGVGAAQSGKEGLGLGLAIVRTIVLAHRGRVGVQNRPQGGACFWFELPLAGAGPCAS